MSWNTTKPTKNLCPAKTRISLHICAVPAHMCSLHCPHEEVLGPWLKSKAKTDQTAWFAWVCCVLAQIILQNGHFTIRNQASKFLLKVLLKRNTSFCMTKPTKWPVHPAKDPMLLHANSEDSDQTGWMPKLIWVFAGRTSFCWFCHVAADIRMTNCC